jgi:cytochrome c553
MGAGGAKEEWTVKNLSLSLVIGFVVLVLSVPSIMLAGGDAEAGKAVYDKKCASCHGKEGEGKAAIAKVMKVELRHLGSAEVQAKSDEQLKKESLEGIGKMKPVKGVSDEDAANLIAYLRTLKQK